MRHGRSGRGRKDNRISVSVRLNLRYLAGIATYLSKGGIAVKNKSDLTHMATEALHTILVKKGLIKEFRSYADAVQYLESVGLHFESSDPKGISELLSRDALEEVTHEFEGTQDEDIKRGLAILGRMNIKQAEEVLSRREDKDGEEKRKEVIPGTGSGIAPIIPDKVKKADEGE